MWFFYLYSTNFVKVNYVYIEVPESKEHQIDNIGNLIPNTLNTDTSQWVKICHLIPCRVPLLRERERERERERKRER